ncbi:MAG: paraquat-inducible protein A [Planctomycetota bacterium]
MSTADTPAKPKGKRMTATRLAIVANLLMLSAIGLGLGLIGPCMTIIPSAGEDLDVWVRLFEPDDLEPRTYSILGGIDTMRHSTERGSTLVAALLFGFSVIFPALKLGVMAWGTAALRLGVRPHAAVKLTSHLGKFSMLDVMVLGLLVLAIKGLPGDTELHLRWAIWAFAISILLSMAASIALHKVRPYRAEVMSDQ